MHHLVPTLDEHDEDVSQSLASPHEDYTSGPILANEGIPHRLTIITACDAFKRDEVIHTISVTMPNAALSKYPEVVHVQTPFSNDITASGDVFIFDYGVLISWALTAQQEADITALLMPCQVKALQSKDVHTETLSFLYSRDVAPNIKNDRITISTHEDGQHAAKLAISHALAQSSKLSVYEGRVAQLVERVRHLPESLALHGAVRMSHKEMSQLMGEVFIQKSEVNLLSSVLDTPDWFWSRPDALKLLYDKVCLYVELEDRVALVNSRIKLLQIILGSCADHSSHTHLTRLENIVIILIVLQVIMAGAEVVGFCLNSR